MKKLILLALVLGAFACQAHARRHILPWRNKAEEPTGVEYTLRPIDSKKPMPAPTPPVVAPVVSNGCNGSQGGCSGSQGGCGGEGRRGLFRNKR